MKSLEIYAKQPIVGLIAFWWYKSIRKPEVFSLEFLRLITLQWASKQFCIILMALAVFLLAPLKALSTPINAVSEESFSTVRAGCAIMHHCCCRPEPRPPADLDTAAALLPQPKFVSIKGSGRLITQSLPSLVPVAPVRSTSLRLGLSPVVLSEPLYILNRALLI